MAEDYKPLWGCHWTWKNILTYHDIGPVIGQSDDLFSRICVCSSATNRQGKKHPLNILCQDLTEDHDKKLSSPSFALNIPGIYITIFVGLFTEVKMIMLLGFIRHHCSILHLSKNLFFAILQFCCQVETSQSLMWFIHPSRWFLISKDGEKFVKFVIKCG